jgi:hypothetical protein
MNFFMMISRLVWIVNRKCGLAIQTEPLEKLFRRIEKKFCESVRFTSSLCYGMFRSDSWSSGLIALCLVMGQGTFSLHTPQASGGAGVSRIHFVTRRRSERLHVLR